MLLVFSGGIHNDTLINNSWQREKDVVIDTGSFYYYKW
jgi:hypothetical protein